MYMRHLGLGVGHERDKRGNNDAQSVELDFGVQPTPELDDYDSEPEIDRNDKGGVEEDQEEDSGNDSEENADAEDEETGGDDEEHSEDSDNGDTGYDKL